MVAIPVRKTSAPSEVVDNAASPFSLDEIDVVDVKSEDLAAVFGEDQLFPPDPPPQQDTVELPPPPDGPTGTQVAFGGSLKALFEGFRPGEAGKRLQGDLPPPGGRGAEGGEMPPSAASEGAGKELDPDLTIEGGEIPADGITPRQGEKLNPETGRDIIDLRDVDARQSDLFDLPVVTARDVQNAYDLRWRDNKLFSPDPGGTGKLTHFNEEYLDAGWSVKEMIEEVSKRYSTDISQAARDKRTHQATRAAANLVGVTENFLAQRLLGRKKGDLLNAEEMLAARDILVWSGTRLDAMADIAMRPGGDSTENLIAFEKALTMHAHIQAQVKGAQTEIARALNSMKIPARDTPGRAARLEEIMGSMGGADTMKKKLEMYNDLRKDGPGAAAKFARGSIRAKTISALYEVWLQSLLSSFQTVGPTGVNVVSNIATTFGQIPTRFVAGMFGAARRAATGAQDGVRMGEGSAMAMQSFYSSWRAIKLAGKTLKTGERPAFLTGTKLDNTAYRHRAFSAEAFQKSGAIGQMIDLAGNLFTMGRYPTKMLEAGDVFFKVFAHDMEVAGQAWRKAAEAGGDPKDFAGRFRDGLLNPTKEALEEGQELAKYVTLTSELGATGKAIQKLTSTPLLRWFVPFTRTPINSLKRFADHSPFAPMLDSYQVAIKQGGAAADLARARMAMGTSVMGVVSTLSMMGYITGGGPKDPTIRNNWIRAGWRPYSIMVGRDETRSERWPDGKPIYVEYKRMDPIATVLGVAADLTEMSHHVFDLGTGGVGRDMRDPDDWGELGLSNFKNATADQWGELAMLMGLAISKNVTSRTYMEGFSALLDAIDDPDSRGADWLQKFMNSWVPRAVSNLERTISPEMKHVRGLVEAMRQDVPGWSDSLPPKRDLWGRKRETYGSMWNPYYLSTFDPEPADDEIIANQVNTQMPAETLTFFNQLVKVELTAGEYDAYAKRAGELSLERVNKLVASKKYQSWASPDRKSLHIKRLIQVSRAQAKMELVKAYPDLKDTIMQEVRKAGGAFKERIEP